MSIPKFIYTFLSLVLILFVGTMVDGQENETKTQKNVKNKNLKKATFGAGCFWCVEAVFQRLEGVEKVISGYTAGQTKNPTYREICTGKTGHAEVCQVLYNSQKITYEELLEVFWKTHNPTTLNRQGNDVGTQYRSAIFYHSEQQKKLAEMYKQKLDKSGHWSDPIVTEITAASKFYPAENYHQNYYNLNPKQPYCTYVVKPKVDKLKKIFKDKLKKKKKTTK